jgi:VWFA-related protein
MHLHVQPRRILARMVLFLFLPWFAVFAFNPAQKNQPEQKPQNTSGTIRVQVGLVQTDVTVYDKQGRFVDDLKPEQFALLVDGKPQPISFLELVSTRGPEEMSAAAKITDNRAIPLPGTPANLPTEGRTLLFFIDDWHLSADSMIRSREALYRLIDRTMGPNDKAAVFAASRQLGFLQQLTDNKSVLQRALERLAFTNETIADHDRPDMDEAEAASIEMGDTDTLATFVAATMKITGMDRPGATALVRQRAATLAQISADVTSRTLASLRSIVSSCGVLPGRKLLFLLSDGFALQFHSDDIVYKLRQVTDAAITAGIVIYTMDARGLVPNESHTFITKQDGLNALASDTGGRFLHNTNALESAMVKTIEETSRYYLLGWHVDPDKLRARHYSSIRVSIPDRPDLRVHLRRDSINLSGLVADEEDRAQHTSTTAASGNGLVKALEYPWPISGLQTSLYCGFLYMPDKNAYVLDISMQAEVERAEAGDGGSRAGMPVEVMGVVADRNGKTVGGFRVSLDKPSDPPKDTGAGNTRYMYSRLISIPPGIYQVRVAASDPRTGHVGSAHQWIEVPQPSPGQIEASSVFLTRPHQDEGVADAGPFPATFDPDQISADCRIASRSRLSYLVQIFNPSDTPVLLRATVYRGNQALTQSPLQKLNQQSPAKTVPQFTGAYLRTDGLTPGAYVLEIFADSGIGKATVTRRLPFWIQ